MKQGLLRPALMWMRDQERLLMTASVLGRNKAEIYNAEKRREAVLDPQVRDSVKSGWLPPRKTAVIQPSHKWEESIRKTMEGPMSDVRTHLHEYRAAGTTLQKHLRHRKPPLEGAELDKRRRKISEKIEKEFGLKEQVDMENTNMKVKSRTKALENSYIHKWAPIEFDQTGAITYLVTKSAAEFATLMSIFSEVLKKYPSFQPRTLFDFGSGLTTGLWAFRESFGAETEAFCVDPSKEMNDLARLILGQGADNPDIPAGVSFRLHNPATVSLEYDLVLSSHSLMELASAEARLEAVHSLWSRVQEGGVLVLVEAGTNAGFQLITEARDFVLQLSHLAIRGEAKETLEGHVLAPCAHDLPCPRFHLDTVPCNFSVRYNNFDLPGLEESSVPKETFSYVVLRKGPRETESLPRLVEPPVITKGDIYCRLCTSDGTLQEVLCRKKHDPELYQVAKRLEEGQELPVTLQPWKEQEKIGTPWLTSKNKQMEEKETSNFLN